MVSDIDIKDMMFNLLKGTSLVSSVTGKLSKRKRPANSDKEDVVISVLANEGNDIQRMFINVNIYVKDDNINGQNEENTTRLRELCSLSSTLFESALFSSNHIYLYAQRVVEVSATGEHLINNKLLYEVCNE